jgi:hypothetical protein
MMSAPGFLEVVEPLFNVFSPALVGLLLAALLFSPALSGFPLAAHSLVFFVSAVRHAHLQKLYAATNVDARKTAENQASHRLP